MTDWTKIEQGGRPAWADALRELLDEAAAVDPGKSTGDALNKRIVAVQKGLIEFIDESDNDVARDLDEVARDTIHDLTSLSIHDALKSINTRTADLARLVKDLEGVTAEARTSALFLSLEPVRSAIDAAGQAIVAFTEARNQIKAGVTEGEALAQQVDDLLDQLQDLRNKFERA